MYPLILCGFLLSLHTLSCSGTTDTLSHGHSLTGVDERLVSENGKFALGFFPPSSKSSDSTVNSYLGIWFNKISKFTPVWTANRDKPISSLTLQKLMISGDGNLVVLAQDNIIWSTNANITANNTVAVLLGNGNLVLRSSLNSSDIFWQSFDYPTDTLLSGAKLGSNKVTGLNHYYVSRKNLIDQASGVYSNRLGFDRSMRISWKTSIEYWSSGEWNGRFFSSIPEMSGDSFSNLTFVDNDQEVYFSYTLLDENTTNFQVFLDVSGQWKVRIWNAHDWVTFSYYPKYQCDVYGVCGAFTICTNNENPPCNCMKGFSKRSPEDWELEDRTGGCIRNTPLNCRSLDKNRTYKVDEFYSVPFIKLPQNGKAILNATSAEACAQVCLSKCSCTAYSYGKGGCSIWHHDLINVVNDADGETLYLRLAAKEVQRWKSKKHVLIIGVAIGVTTSTLVVIFLMVIWRSGKWSNHAIDNDHQDTIGVIAFKYDDMKRATKHFSEKLGGGGFGSVFKGYLTDSIAIAVKRLDNPRQGEKQFRAEVSSIGIIQHVNLVKLIGFCCEGDRRLLVYEHMPNSSLDVHLFQSHGIVLGWDIRYKIALGVARGLAYLHHSCRDCIIHCDIKPQNILLGTCFIPKIADFGMAKFLGRDFSRVVTTMRGTIGYLAPEWLSGTAITSKVDVYSYGMVLLEIISGRRNSGKESSTDDDHAGYFPVQVANKLLDGDVGTLVDTDLHDEVNMEEVERVCKVACWCIQDNEFQRPTMIEVVQILEGTVQQEMPPVPRLLRAIAGDSHST
ncbi:hypothetical protein EJB05_52778, partial [Eragrostis curvula]